MPGHKVTILGSGSSGGVPRIGGDWGVCDPDEPRNRRLRCSILVQQGGTNALIDTSPDMREQLLMARISHLHGVLYTHSHADQANGIDDLRMVVMNMRKRVNVYADEVTFNELNARFGYCFSQAEGASYPAILNGHLIKDAARVEGPGGVIEAAPFLVDHGGAHCVGYRFGNFAYTPDIVNLPEAGFAAIAGVDCWIVDALRYTPHPTHSHLARTLEWIARVKPKLAVLTNLHIDMDYHTLLRELPEGVVPAYDGMELEF
ncbi:MAG: MBL fold metallo-hydrolase [Alphaproteobacteria bacterium]